VRPPGPEDYGEVTESHGVNVPAIIGLVCILGLAVVVLMLLWRY
jgi:hypothetical protein